MPKLNILLTSVGILFFSILNFGCSSTPIKGFVSEGMPLSPISKAIVFTQPGLYPDVKGAVQQELANRGIIVVEVEDSQLESQMKSTKADTVIWVNATKAWDIYSYIKYMEVRIFNAKSGSLLGIGKWETRWWHGSRSTKEVVKDLITTVLDRTQQNQK